MRKLNDIDCSNICDDYLLGLSYNLLSVKYNVCTWSIGNVLSKNNIKSRIRKHKCNEDYFDGDGSIGKYNGRLKFSLLGTYEVLTWILHYFNNKGMVTTPKISKKRNIHSVQVNSKTDIELIENILYISSNDYYLKRKKEKFN